jgi:geranylgeranyl diphosphate synthase type II
MNQAPTSTHQPTAAATPGNFAASGATRSAIDVGPWIESALEQALDDVIEGRRGGATAAQQQIDEEFGAATAPPALAAAMRHAVFPGGARVRPRLCLAVGMACGMRPKGLLTAGAAAIELLHCASLVHDDLPCFDNAPLRRGQLSVHAAYGERLAVLAGDALIVLAFDVLGRVIAESPLRAAQLLRTVSAAVGMPGGIVAGQAWECESDVELSAYQRAKTGALFVAAAVAGAQAAGESPLPWQRFGERLGEAYQVADDLRDVAADANELGKPVGRDVALDRPSAARQYGFGGAVRHFQSLVAAAMAAIPPCPGAAMLRQMVEVESLRLVPLEWQQRAA